MKYQCYYYYTPTYNFNRVNTECFDTEAEAERYCSSHVGIVELDDDNYVEREMMYEEV